MSAKSRRRWEEFVDKGYAALADYNAERDRGLVHTPEYTARMAEVQERFNAEKLAEARENGWTVIDLTKPDFRKAQ